jgi:hypothetical protein
MAAPGPLPKIHLVTVSVADLQSGSTELTPAVQQSLPAVVEAVRWVLAAPPTRGSA